MASHVVEQSKPRATAKSWRSVRGRRIPASRRRRDRRILSDERAPAARRAEARGPVLAVPAAVTTSTLARSLALTLTLAALGCGGDDAASPDGGGGLDAGNDDFHVDRVGVINLMEGGSFLGVFASITDGPERPVPTVIASDGDCAVYRRPAPSLCEGSCDGVCEDGVCRPWPATRSAGTITITGLRQALAFEPSSFGYAPSPPPPDELFADGATIGVSAAGAAVGGFSVELTGPTQLVAPFQNLTLVDGQPATVTWTAASSGRIQVSLVVGWHGAPWEAMLLCETADDGELIIPGALVSALPRASSGLESHVSNLTRFDRTSVLGPDGVIEVIAGSQTNLYFSHP